MVYNTVYETVYEIVEQQLLEDGQYNLAYKIVWPTKLASAS